MIFLVLVLMLIQSTYLFFPTPNIGHDQKQSESLFNSPKNVYVSYLFLCVLCS